MTKEQFEREKSYQTMIAVSKRMLREDIITPGEFKRIESYLNNKYHPLFRTE